MNIQATKERPKSALPKNDVRISGRTNELKGANREEEAFKKYKNVTIWGIKVGIPKLLLIKGTVLLMKLFELELEMIEVQLNMVMRVEQLLQLHLKMVK